MRALVKYVYSSTLNKTYTALERSTIHQQDCIIKHIFKYYVGMIDPSFSQLDITM